MFSVWHVAQAMGWTPPDSALGCADAILRFPDQGRSLRAENPDQKDDRIVSGNAFALRGLLDA